MLIRFVVNNFLSFSEEREFNMIASSYRSHKHHVYNAGKVDVLKAGAIYGANGAGKSNLIKAIDFLQDIILNKRLYKSVDDKKFKLDSEFSNKPIEFEIEYSINKKIYSYGLSIDNSTIIDEWLYESGIDVDDKIIFERKSISKDKSKITVPKKFKKSKKQELLFELMEDNLLKSNEVLVGKYENLNIPEVEDFYNWITKDVQIIYPESKFNALVPAFTQSKKFKLFANDLLQTFDTGVTELDIENVKFETFFGEEDEDLKKEFLKELDEGHSIVFRSEKGPVLITIENKKPIVKKVISIHKDQLGNKIKFDLDEESDGTQRLLDFIPAFDYILERDITIIIDEIDQSLHPTLLKSMIKKIMDDKETKGQMIFSTHESNLLDLDIFRPDEVWFAEKNKTQGNTEIYSLHDFKPRNDLDIRKGYLKGRFGAIPFLAQLEDLNWTDSNA